MIILLIHKIKSKETNGDVNPIHKQVEHLTPKQHIIVLTALMRYSVPLFRPTRWHMEAAGKYQKHKLDPKKKILVGTLSLDQMLTP